MSTRIYCPCYFGGRVLNLSPFPGVGPLRLLVDKLVGRPTKLYNDIYNHETSKLSE
jgi:hypothetical protein